MYALYPSQSRYLQDRVGVGVPGAGGAEIPCSRPIDRQTYRQSNHMSEQNRKGCAVLCRVVCTFGAGVCCFGGHHPPVNTHCALAVRACRNIRQDSSILFSPKHSTVTGSLHTAQHSTAQYLQDIGCSWTVRSVRLTKRSKGRSR